MSLSLRPIPKLSRTRCTGSWNRGGTLREAVLRAIPQLRGAYGTVIMDTRDPGTLLAARSGSPLVIGTGMGEKLYRF